KFLRGRIGLLPVPLPLVLSWMELTLNPAGIASEQIHSVASFASLCWETFQDRFSGSGLCG
ncbi:MAG: hypothetical protein II379_03580, partial [Oscillospiraceae bacterium]|nr:hypothetical protein [Oscillospiraceae bacterium]